jgi:microcompartment protein CcmK/EutM
MEHTHSRKACRIAEEEIAAGKVKWVLSTPGQSAAAAVANEALDRALGQ